MSSFNKVHQGSNRDETLTSRLATIFPFAKLRQRDLAEAINPLEAEVLDFRKDDSPDKWARIPGMIPRFIGLIHSISSADLAIVEYTVADGDFDFVVHFPRLPITLGIEHDKPVASVDLLAFMAWCEEASHSDDRPFGPDRTLTALIERKMAVASWRYRGFSVLKWNAFVAQFLEQQSARAYRDLFQFLIVQDKKDVVDFVKFVDRVEKYYKPVNDILNRIYRCLLVLDPAIPQSWGIKVPVTQDADSLKIVPIDPSEDSKTIKSPKKISKSAKLKKSS